MGIFPDLFMYFAIYSFFGWLVESIFASICERRLVNRGFLHGFFCPIYGFSAILIIQSSNFVKLTFNNSIATLASDILLSIVLVTALEFVTGYLLEKLFNCKWWDYSRNAFNLYGYICLQYSLLWGAMAFLLLYVAHPAVAVLVSRIPSAAKLLATALLLLYFIADTAKTVTDILDLRKVILYYPRLSLDKYRDKIIKYKRLFLAFPRLLMLNANILNRDVRSILYEKIDKLKDGFKNRF